MSIDLIASMAGGIAYAASVVTHLGILKFNTSRKGNTMNVFDDIRTALDKVQNLDTEVVDAATKISGNPALKPLVQSVAALAEKELPPEVTVLLTELVGAAVKFAGTSPAPVKPAVEMPAVSSELPGRVPRVDETPVSEATPSAAQLMGLPQ